MVTTSVVRKSRRTSKFCAKVVLFVKLLSFRTTYDPKAYLASLTAKASTSYNQSQHSQAPPNVTLFSPATAQKFLHYSSSLATSTVPDFENFHSWPPVPNVNVTPYRCLGEREMSFSEYQATRSPSSYPSSSSLVPYNEIMQEHQALYNTMANAHTMASSPLTSEPLPGPSYASVQYDGGAYYGHASRFTPFS